MNSFKYLKTVQCDLDSYTETYDNKMKILKTNVFTVTRLFKVHILNLDK